MPPTGFTTVAPVRGRGRLQQLDAEIARLIPDPQAAQVALEVEDAVRLPEMEYSNVVYDDEEDDRYQSAMLTSLRWLSNTRAANDTVTWWLLEIAK